MPPAGARDRVRVLFLVEGFTDIRFVVGLSEICELTMIAPSAAYRSSGLADRVAESGASLRVIELAGGRVRFQLASLGAVWRHARECHAILSQELLRGSLNANVVGRLRRKPVVTTMGIAPLEYFQCRRERREIGAATAWLGGAIIRALVAINGRLVTRCLAMGPYLRDVALRSCPRTEIGLYYGVDVDRFRPADADERDRLRRRLNLPRDKFLVVFASRLSHEKDPETVIRAVAIARGRGLDACLLNLGGGYQEFLALPDKLGIEDAASWTIARPPVHPMKDLADYLRSADVVVQASLAEGAAFSTLEGLACETPVVATAVGGMAVQLRDYARLTLRQDAESMAQGLLAVAADPDRARQRARSGREYVCREWSRAKAFQHLESVLIDVTGRAPASGPSVSS